jgi:hypothetical protein
MKGNYEALRGHLMRTHFKTLNKSKQQYTEKQYRQALGSALARVSRFCTCCHMHSFVLAKV